MALDGIIKCIRYAFGPNKLHLCGPDANATISQYLTAGFSDGGLTNLLGQFKTMYPYLTSIARVNKIVDPFDEHVVEAYWLGNSLLEKIGKKEFYSHITDNSKIKKTLKPKEFETLASKLQSGAKMHHSFHVFNIWKRLGDGSSYEMLNNMEKCRISWGEVISINGPSIGVRFKPLLLGSEGKLFLGSETEKKIIRKLYDDYLIEVQLGD